MHLAQFWCCGLGCDGCSFCRFHSFLLRSRFICLAPILPNPSAFLLVSSTCITCDMSPINAGRPSLQTPLTSIRVTFIPHLTHCHAWLHARFFRLLTGRRRAGGG